MYYCKLVSQYCFVVIIYIFAGITNTPRTLYYIRLQAAVCVMKKNSAETV